MGADRSGERGALHSSLIAFLVPTFLFVRLIPHVRADVFSPPFLLAVAFPEYIMIMIRII